MTRFHNRQQYPLKVKEVDPVILSDLWSTMEGPEPNPARRLDVKQKALKDGFRSLKLNYRKIDWRSAGIANGEELRLSCGAMVQWFPAFAGGGRIAGFLARSKYGADRWVPLKPLEVCTFGEDIGARPDVPLIVCDRIDNTLAALSHRKRLEEALSHKDSVIVGLPSLGWASALGEEIKRWRNGQIWVVFDGDEAGRVAQRALGAGLGERLQCFDGGVPGGFGLIDWMGPPINSGEQMRYDRAKEPDLCDAVSIHAPA